MDNERTQTDTRLSLLCRGSDVFLGNIDPEGMLGSSHLESVSFSRYDSGEWFWRVLIVFPSGDKIYLGGRTQKGGQVISHGAVQREGGSQEISLLASGTLKGAVAGLSWLPEVLNDNLVVGEVRQPSQCPIGEYLQKAYDGFFYGIDGGGVNDGLRSHFLQLVLTFLSPDKFSIVSFADAASGRVKIEMIASDSKIVRKKVFLQCHFGVSGVLVSECMFSSNGMYFPSLTQAFALAKLLGVSEIPPSMRDEGEAIADELAKPKPSPKPEQQAEKTELPVKKVVKVRKREENNEETMEFRYKAKKKTLIHNAL